MDGELVMGYPKEGWWGSWTVEVDAQVQGCSQGWTSRCFDPRRRSWQRAEPPCGDGGVHGAQERAVGSTGRHGSAVRRELLVAREDMAVRCGEHRSRDQ